MQVYVANTMINAFDIKDRETWAGARALGSEFLSQRNGDYAHTITALGHCHIDTAWLWPYAETRRKACR